jgi:hypothetical protein
LCDLSVRQGLEAAGLSVVRFSRVKPADRLA